MTCNCGSDRILAVSGKVSDTCFMSQGEYEHEGYVPGEIGLGSGDYIRFDVCLDCGQIQEWDPRRDLHDIIEGDDEDEDE